MCPYHKSQGWLSFIPSTDPTMTASFSTRIASFRTSKTRNLWSTLLNMTLERLPKHFPNACLDHCYVQIHKDGQDDTRKYYCSIRPRRQTYSSDTNFVTTQSPGPWPARTRLTNLVRKPSSFFPCIIIIIPFTFKFIHTFNYINYYIPLNIFIS